MNEVVVDYSIQKLDKPSVHRWYRFVLSYPDHFVRDMISRSGIETNGIILDPFLGTGTTVVESRKLGFNSIGIEANPICVLASRVKSNWSLNSDKINEYFKEIKSDFLKEIKSFGNNEQNMSSKGLLSYINTNVSNSNSKPLMKIDHKLLNEKYISPLPWTKICLLKQLIFKYVKEKEFLDLFLLILAKTFRYSANVKFGPEIGYIKPKLDVDVISFYETSIKEVVEDLQELLKKKLLTNPIPSVFEGDSRFINTILKDYQEKIDLVITSPSYPVDKDYTRITRLESSILDIFKDIKDVQVVKKNMIRSSTRQIYKSDHEKEKLKDIPIVFQISNKIIELCNKDGDTSGFSKMYPRLVEEYFGGLYTHLENLYPLLKKGAKSYYLLGDSRSFKMVLIETAKIVGEIAKNIGYKNINVETFRNRNSTAHDSDLLENILIFEK